MAEENRQTELPKEQPQQSTTPPRRSVAPLSGVNVAPKSTWPEVVGMTVEEAERKIREDMPRVHFQVLPPNHFATMDFNPRRVRLHVDSSGKVVQPPRIG